MAGHLHPAAKVTRHGRSVRRRAFVTDDVCPHDGGKLSDGFVDGGKLVCARHGWEFDGCTGACPERDVVIATRLLGRKT